MTENNNNDDDSIPLEPREFLEEMILAIVVNDPDQVRVEEIRSTEKNAVYNVVVSDRDRGLVIGKEGSTAAHIKGIMTLIGQRVKKYIEVRIDGGANHRPKPRVQHQHDEQQQYQHQNGNHQRQHNQFKAPPGYVMVPASALVQVPDTNFNGKRRTYNNNRSGHRHQED